MIARFLYRSAATLLFLWAAGRAGTQPPQPDYAAEMKTATEALAAKDFAGAARHSRSALTAAQQNGDKARALDCFARAESGAGNKANALAAYAFINALVPPSHVLAENAVNNAPDLCRAADASALVAAVEALAREAPGLEATVPQALAGIAYIGYHWAKSYAIEKELCREVLKRFPQDRAACAYANHYTGCALLGERRYEQAYATFRANARKYADQRGIAANSLHMIAWGLSQYEKKPEEALVAVAAVFETFPDQAWALEMDASIATQCAPQLDDKGKGIGQLQKLIAGCQAPGALTRLCIGTADLCIGLGRFNEARALLAKAEATERDERGVAEGWERLDDKTFDPEDVDEGLSIVRRRIGRGKLDDAERMARAMVAASPDKPLSHVALADVLRSRRDDQAAEREYRQALTMAPQHPEAHFGLGLLYERTGRDELAWREWDSFLASAHDDPRTLLVRHAWVVADAEKLPLPMGRCSSPAFSPDGKRMAYSKLQNDHWDLCMFDLVSRKETPIAKCPDNAKGYHVPQWTPDGRNLVFDVDYGWPDTDLLIVPADGSAAPKPFLPAVPRSYNARFTLDGKRVVFAGPENSIWIADGDGRNPKELIHKLPWGEMVGLSTPQLMPDGGRLLCSVSRDQWETYDLYAVEVEQPGKFSLLAKGQYQIRYALLSPDGRSIVFARSDAWHKKEDKRHLWIASADGNSMPQKLVRGTFEWESPAAWSPDGRKIVYATKAGGADALGRPGRYTSVNDLRMLTLAGLPGRGLGLALIAGTRGVTARVTCRSREPVQVTCDYQVYDTNGACIASHNLTEKGLALKPDEVVELPVPVANQSGQTVKLTAVTDKSERMVRLVDWRKP